MRLMKHKGPLYGQSSAHCSEMRLRCFVSGPLHFLLRFRLVDKRKKISKKKVNIDQKIIIIWYRVAMCTRNCKNYCTKMWIQPECVRSVSRRGDARWTVSVERAPTAALPRRIKDDFFQSCGFRQIRPSSPKCNYLSFFTSIFEALASHHDCRSSSCIHLLCDPSIWWTNTKVFLFWKEFKLHHEMNPSVKWHFVISTEDFSKTF